MKNKKLTFEITFINGQGRTLTKKIKALSSKDALLALAINPEAMVKIEMYY